MFSLSLCLAMLDSEEEQEEFTAFYNRYSRLVRHQAWQIVKNNDAVQDVMQEVFLYIAKKFSKFKDKDSQEKTRLVVICARSRAKDFLRNEAADRFADSAITDGQRETANIASITMMEESFDTEEIILTQEAIQRIFQIVSELPDRYRDVLELKFKDFSAQEISEALGIPIETVYKRIQRGYLIVRERMADEK